MRNAWRISGMSFVFNSVLRALGYVIFAVMVGYMISDKANAIEVAADYRLAAKVKQQASYIKELEAVLARCLHRGDSPIWIGDELYMCGMAPAGVKR